MAHEWEALANDPAVKPLLGVTYMRHAERRSEADEIEAMDRKLTDPVERRFLQNPGKLKQQNDRRKANLVAQSPPTDLTPTQRDTLAKLESVAQRFVVDNMPTQEQMRHNPPGAVDHHMAWDRKVKKALLTWKNVRILLNPQSDAVDLANFERYRPANAATRNLFSDGQIPGQWALSPQAKENFDRIDFSDDAFAQEAARRGYTLVQRGAPAAGRPAAPEKAPPKVTATCDECGVQYRGGFGPANLKTHKAKMHVREEVSA